MKRIISRKPIAVLMFFLFSGSVLLAQSSPFYYGGESESKNPDSSEIRQKLESWVHAPINEARAQSTGVFRQSVDGSMVRVRSEETEDFFYQLFLIEKDFSYPVARRGNFIIKRDKADGSFIQVKIFLRDEPGSFIRIFPLDERTVLDVFLLGRQIYGDVILPLSLSQVFTTPLSRIMSVTDSRINWDVFNSPPSSFTSRYKLDILKTIRSEILRLYDCDDGAMDRDGNYIYIETLETQKSIPGGFNCSGFVKWVADGFSLPLSGELLDIEELKRKHADFRGNSWSDFSEDERDPFFGLDWTRNIAINLEELRTRFAGGGGRDSSDFAFSSDYESADVREIPYFSYIEDVGWKIADLGTILYLLAKNEPDNFYLGSVNVSWGEDQVLRQHTHVVVLFPYFTALGQFKTAVFERNRETGLASLSDRYENDYIHLVRIKAEGDFYLP